jgi:hypothetical protein
MSNLPVKNEDTDHSTKDSDFTNTVADLDIIDLIPGVYGSYLYLTDDDFVNGEESHQVFNGL